MSTINMEDNLLVEEQEKDDADAVLMLLNLKSGGRSYVVGARDAALAWWMIQEQ